MITNVNSFFFITNYIFISVKKNYWEFSNEFKTPCGHERLMRFNSMKHASTIIHNTMKFNDKSIKRNNSQHYAVIMLENT